MRIYILSILLSTLVFAGQITDELYEAALDIRGVNCGVDCNSGGDLSAYKESIKLALENPREFAKNLPPKEDFEKMVDEDREYMRFWAVKSFGNYMLYEKFSEKYRIALAKLTEYYKSNFKFDDSEAIFFATHLANEIQNMAVGSILKPYALNDLQKNVKNKALDLNKLLANIYASKQSPSQLTELLNIALLYGQNISVIETLLNLGANLNFGDESPLFFALRDKNMVEFLIKRGAEVNYENCFGKTPLFYAVELEDEALINLLISHGANVNKRYISKSMKDAMASGFSILPFYQDFCALEHTNRSVFMHAAMHSNPSILALLVKNGADILAVDDIGYNALDYAKDAQKTQNIEYLQSLKLQSSR